jgi:hypothetical protein
MPTNRFQFSDDFVLNANKVGINSSTPQEELDVVGVVKADNLKVTGVSSFTSYEGFLNSNHNITENITLTSGTSGSLSGEIIVGTGITLSGNNSTTSGQGHIDSLKVYNTLTIPVGGTTERPSKANPGQLYYNKDFATIEFWDGNNWRQVDYTTRSGKILFGPGNAGLNNTSIDTINAHTLGNATYFGEVSSARATYGGGGGNHQRGLFTGGYVYSNVIDYVTIQSEGNAINFGDLSKPAFGMANSSSSTRSISWFGTTNVPAGGTAIDNIEYVEISTTGDAQDFGDSGQTGWSASAGASPTRGIYCGRFGDETIAANKQTRYITIASKGNAIQFGELSGVHGQQSGKSNSIKMLMVEGSETVVVHITSLNIPSLGRPEPFGDLSVPRQGTSVSCTQTRGIIGGGNSPGSTFNVIEYVTMSSEGNGVDFGDLTTIKRNSATISDSHGGLGGF